MRASSPFRVASLIVLAGTVACADSPVAPIVPPNSASLAKAAAGGGSEDNVIVSPRIAEINAQLTAIGAKVHLSSVALLRGPDWQGKSATLIIANDRVRGIGAEWVKGDPLRNGRIGVAYQVAPHLGVAPFVINPDRATVRAATLPELDALIEEAMSAWRNETCSDAPITRFAIPPQTDPTFLDNLFSGQPRTLPYVQSADIVHGGWYPPSFFRNIAVFFGEPPESGDGIIGITFTFTYVDEEGNPTDIDRNRKLDIGLAEIYYNAGFVYDNSGLVDLRVVDFFSVLAHETGHALGLGHLGKIFVTGPDLRDGVITLSEVKYAPYALMNASYIAGRNFIAGLDRSQFCQIWAGR